jgi:hypothetical protein
MINCKNCSFELNKQDSFCKACGAKVIRDRITIKSLFSNLLLALGWDSNFFTTLKHLLYKPQIVLKDYINGTRKKYADPFSFFAIILAISLLLFSHYSEEFMQMATDIGLEQTRITENKLTDNVNESKGLEMLGYKSQAEFSQAIVKFQLQYYNLFAFFSLPIYTLIAFLVFRKPYNFGEHLVINTYLQSITTFLSVFLFLFSLLFGMNIFGIGVSILPFFYYCFAYKSLYKLTFVQLLLKVFKFIGILLLFMLIPLIMGIVSVVLHK